MKQGIPREVALDVGISISTWSVDGDAETGYRITTKIPAGQSFQTQTMLVLKTPEGFRLGGSGFDSMGGLALEHLMANREQAARTVLGWVAEDLKAQPTAAGGAKSPFLRLYAPEAGPEELRVASASLMAMREYEPVAAPILNAALAKETDPDRRNAIRLALATIYATAEKHKESADTAEPLLESELSLQSLMLFCSGRSRAGAGEECIRVAEPLIDRLGQEEAVYSLITSATGEMGDFDRTYEYAMRSAARRDGGVMAANTAAWATLYTGAHREEALSSMRKQLLVLPQGGNAGSLHTLICLEAELDQPMEAKRHAEQVMEAWGLDEPNASMWLAYGLIYQGFGLRSEAIQAFERSIATEKNKSPLSSGELARRKLAALRKVG